MQTYTLVMIFEATTTVLRLLMDIYICKWICNSQLVLVFLPVYASIHGLSVCAIILCTYVCAYPCGALGCSLLSSGVHLLRCLHYGNDGGCVQTGCGGQQTASSGFQTSGEALQGSETGTQPFQLPPHACVLWPQPLHLPLQLLLLLLQGLALGHALHPAARRVAAVFQRASPLFQLLHFLAWQTAQVRVELAHRQRHELTVAQHWDVLPAFPLHLK